MTTSTPTVVLVHGAFADSASWSGVVAELQSHGIPVVAPPNPLRGLAVDAAYVASVAAQIDGPVVLVGHSYGGAVITGEADVLRDEGEAYAAKLREAGVPVTAARYQGIIHDFVMLNALSETHAARAAIAQAIAFLKAAL